VRTFRSRAQAECLGGSVGAGCLMAKTFGSPSGEPKV
jgi:hypothetical protein